jgi:hypothetical protein
VMRDRKLLSIEESETIATAKTEAGKLMAAAGLSADYRENPI